MVNYALAGLTESNSTLKVAIAKWLPWIDFQKSAEGHIVHLVGPMAALLEHFKKSLRVSFEYFEPPDGSWGKKVSNGSYNGMIGMVHRNEVDLAVGPFTMTQERAAVVRFTNPIFFDFVTILVGSQKEDKPLFPFLHVFQKRVWLLSLVAFIGSVILHVFIELIVKRRDRRKSLAFIVYKAFVPFWGSLTSKSLAISRQSTTSQNVLLTSWMFFSALLCWTLSGQLLSFLVISKPEQFIDSLEAFQKFPHVIPLLESGTTAESMLENSKTDAAKYLWQTVQKNTSVSLVPTKKFHTKEQLDLIVSDTNYAAITEKTSVMALLAERVEKKWSCGFHATELKSFVKPMSVALSQFLPPQTVQLLSICAHQMVESAMIDEQIKKNSENFDSCLQVLSDGELSVLDFSDVAGIFIVYAGGNLIAITIYLVEIIINYYGKL